MLYIYQTQKTSSYDILVATFLYPCNQMQNITLSFICKVFAFPVNVQKLSVKTMIDDPKQSMVFGNLSLFLYIHQNIRDQQHIDCTRYNQSIHRLHCVLYLRSSATVSNVLQKNNGNSWIVVKDIACQIRCQYFCVMCV